MDADILNLAVTVSGAGEAEQELLQALCSAARQRWELRNGHAPKRWSRSCREDRVLP